jgi:hypothetical protein
MPNQGEAQMGKIVRKAKRLLKKLKKRRKARSVRVEAVLLSLCR